MNRSRTCLIAGRRNRKKSSSVHPWFSPHQDLHWPLPLPRCRRQGQYGTFFLLIDLLLLSRVKELPQSSPSPPPLERSVSRPCRPAASYVHVSLNGNFYVNLPEYRPHARLPQLMKQAFSLKHFTCPISLYFCRDCGQVSDSLLFFFSL